MSDQNISQILAALSGSRPAATPGSAPPGVPGAQPYQQAYPTPPPPNASGLYSLPQPSSSGNVDLSSIKPSNSGSVNLAEAVARARGSEVPRNGYDRGYSRRSRSRSPPRGGRDGQQDTYNAYRDDRRGGGYGRDRSLSPSGARYGDRDRSSYGAGGDAGVETISIDSSLVGLIIGRAGENLRRIEAQSGTRIQFLTGQDGGPQRPCKISGPRPSREIAKAEIMRTIEQHGKGTSMGMSYGSAPPPMPMMPGYMPPVGAMPPVMGAMQPLPGPEEQMQMMVPNRTVGLIIGRGGETIRDLQQRSGCHVNILGEDKTVSGLRPVNLVGSREQAAIAKDLIMEIVESDTKNMTQHASGPMMKPAPVMTPYGRADAVGDRITDNIMVPSESVGMIIGKGGETIRDMQNVSGCKINVAQPTPPDFERDVQLIGTHEAIEGAKRLIMDKVRTVEEKNRGGGGRAPPTQYNPTAYGQAPQPYGAPPPGAGAAPPSAPYGQSYPQYPQPGGTPAASNPADPYAPYGGYENYAALWYSQMLPGQQQGAPVPGAGQPYPGAGGPA